MVPEPVLASSSNPASAGKSKRHSAGAGVQSPVTRGDTVCGNMTAAGARTQSAVNTAQFDAARAGLNVHITGGGLFELDCAATGYGRETAGNSHGANRAAAGGCADASFDVVKA